MIILSLCRSAQFLGVGAGLVAAFLSSFVLAAPITSVNIGTHGGHYGINSSINFELGIAADWTIYAYAYDVILDESNIGDSYILDSGNQFDLLVQALSDNQDEYVRERYLFPDTGFGGPGDRNLESELFPGINFASYSISGFELRINDLFLFSEPDSRWFQGYRTDYLLDTTFIIHGTASIPIPAAAWFFLSAVGGLIGFKRRFL